MDDADLAIDCPARIDAIFGGRNRQHAPHLIDLLKDMQKAARMESLETVW